MAGAECRTAKAVEPEQDGDSSGLGLLGSGIVTRAPFSGRRVVVKTLADRFADDPVRRARFMRAAELGMRLSHPNVVRVFEAGVEGRPYVVMEYVDGSSLEERLEGGGGLAADEALTLATHLAAGLAHAHANGVVHGSLSCRNILVGRDGVARIGDFGFARLLGGDDRPSPADDVYDLAMVLRRVGADCLSPRLNALVEAAAGDPSVRPSAFDVFHQVVTIGGPAEVWVPPAGVQVLAAQG
jgi:serine/threonine protein kinase